MDKILWLTFLGHPVNSFITATPICPCNICCRTNVKSIAMHTVSSLPFIPFLSPFPPHPFAIYLLSFSFSLFIYIF